MPDLAEIAYNAYCQARSWTSFNGDPLPHFAQQSQPLQDAWAKAADAVAAAIHGMTAGPG